MLGDLHSEILMAAYFAAVSLMQNKRRVLLSLIGVAVGISAIIALLLVGRSMEGELRRSLESLGSDVFTVQINFLPETLPADGENQFSARDMPKLLADDILSIVNVIKSQPEVSAVGVLHSITSCSAGTGSGEGAQIYLADEQVIKMLRLIPLEGRFVGALDHNQASATVGYGFDMNSLLQYQDGSSQFGLLDICGRYYEVVGRASKSNVEEVMPALRINDSIFISTSHWSSQMVNGITPILLVKLQPWVDGDFDQIFSKRLSGVLPYSFSVSGARQIERIRKEQLTIYNNFFLLLGAVSLIVGSLGVANLMYTCVSERRSEIGLRVAIGASRSSIVWQFLIESVLVCMLGALVGIAFGLAVGSVAVSMLGESIVFSISDAVVAAFLALACGCLAGVLPAKKAADIDPVLCLQEAHHG